MMKTAIKFLTGAALLFPAGLCRANTYTAPTCGFNDVSNTCYAVAAPGDTVVMPPGSAVWNNTLTLPTGISLAGSGTNQTTIICGADANGNIMLIACNALASNYVTRISSFTIQGSTNVNYNDWGCIWMNSDRTGPASQVGHAVPWRIDHVVFNGVPMNNIKVQNVHSGLIDDCTFNISQVVPGQILRLTDSDSDYSGSYSWSVPYPYGGTNALYVENCFFTNSAAYLCGLDDCDYGGSLVFRFNTAYNCQLNNHGTENATGRSQRSFEIYNNTLIANDPSTIWSPAILLRGGTGVICSNTVSGWKAIEYTFYKRMMQWCVSYDGADGLSQWDSNDPTIYLQGIWTNSAVAANSNFQNNNGLATFDLTLTNLAPWTPNQWAGFVIVNTNAPYISTDQTNNPPVYWFGSIVSNTTNTLTLIAPKNGFADRGTNTPCFTLNPGDPYQFVKVIRGLDQIGVGSGDLLATVGNYTVYDTVTGGPPPPLANEVNEPLYWWSNTLNGAAADFSNCGFAIIQPNRDFFNNVPRPNYNPLPFPNPLILGTKFTILAPISPPSGLGVFKK